MSSRLPADLMAPPETSQFSLRQLLEAVGWAASLSAYLGYLSHGSLRPEDAGWPLVLSPMLLLGGVGALVGSLKGRRWQFLACGLLVGATPLLLALGLVLFVKR